MWLGGHLLAATAAEGANDSLIVMVGGVIVAALGVLSAVLVEIIRGRNSRTTASPPPPTTSAGGKDVELYERTAVLSRRADDADERHHMFERTIAGHFDEHGERIERIERHLGIYEEGG